MNYVNFILRNSNIKQVVYVPVEKKFRIKSGIHSVETNDRISMIIDPVYWSIERFIWPLKQLKITIGLLKKFNSRAVSLIHAHTLVVNGLVSYFLNVVYKTPYVVTVRNTDINFFLKKLPFFKFIVKPVLNNAKLVYFLNSNYFEVKLKEVYGHEYLLKLRPKVRVICNGLDDQWLFDFPKERKPPNDNINILFVGSLVPNKNLKGVIKACVGAKDIGLNIRLSIVGEGPDSVLLNDALGIEIIYHGYVKCTSELISIYRDNHIFLLPSFTESFGLVYAEALSQGLPVLYTKDEGFDGQFEEGWVGYSVNPKDTQDIVRKIYQIISNYEILTKRCLIAAKKFNWDYISKEMVESYKSVGSK